MPSGVGGAVQAARFAGSLGVAAARAGWCPPGGFPITRTSAAYTGLAVRYWVWIPLRSNGDRMKCFNYVLTKYV